MKVALISDLHGNLVALRAVLRDASRLGADRVCCLGDTATLGPQPRPVLQVLRETSEPCVLGNHDAFMLDPELIHSYSESPEVVAAVDWCRDQLRAPDFALLRTFVDTRQLDLGHGRRLMLYHGTPRSHMEDLLVTTPAAQVDEMLAGFTADVYAGGHTHLPMLRHHGGAVIINPGSVGLPFIEPVGDGPPVVRAHAEYALVESTESGLDVRLRRLYLDRTELLQALRGSGCPTAGYLRQQYRRSAP